MKASTLQKRLDRSPVSKNSKPVEFVKQIISGSGVMRNAKEQIVIRPCYTSGSGRFTKNLDYTQQTLHVLGSLGLKVILTNDAPRGSATGNLITVLTKIEY